MADQIIQLSSNPNQTTAITLSVDDKDLTLQLAVRFNELAGYWVMTISDQFGVVMVDSVPLLTGGFPAANILAQYGYLGIGSAYIINNGTSSMDTPDKTNLGTDFSLLWSDPS